MEGVEDITKRAADIAAMSPSELEDYANMVSTCWRDERRWRLEAQRERDEARVEVAVLERGLAAAWPLVIAALECEAPLREAVQRYRDAFLANPLSDPVSDPATENRVSTGDPNEIRTRVTGVRGRCERSE